MKMHYPEMRKTIERMMNMVSSENEIPVGDSQVEALQIIFEDRVN
jgi:hypothetical protein